MKRSLIVLEDSSKAKFGGGQQVSLIVAEILSEFYYLTLFDTNDNSVFFKKALKYFDKTRKLISFGRIQSGLVGKLYRFIEFLVFPLLLVINLFLIYQELKSDKNSWIYATTKKSLIYAYGCKLLFKSNFIYHAHLIENNLFISIVYRKLLKSAFKIIAVSEVVKNNIALSDVIIIYNPTIDTFPETPKSQRNKVIVATFGSLVRIKGIKYFLTSKKYLNTTKDVEYWIFGEGQERKSLQKYASDKIIFKGFSNHVIDEMRQNIDILCFPTIVEEACPVTIIEALSCGLPVITTNIGGQAELVKNEYNGFLVPIKNSYAIAEKLNFLINNPIEYSKFSKNAQNSLNPFSFEIFKAKILEIIFKSISLSDKDPSIR